MSTRTTGFSVRLTAHPLQRVGAFALSSLVHRGPVRLKQLTHPVELTEEDLRAANANMTRDLGRTTSIATSKEPGGFWLGTSYLFWPNCPINTTNRKSLLGQDLKDKLAQWRNLPEADTILDVRCVLCDHPACGFYGKVDVPLLESSSYRNTTIPTHEGMALCRGCLLSFYALPYGCAIGGGRATALHSWDDNLLRALTKFQVDQTRRQAVAGAPAGERPAYARQLAALVGLRGLRSYEETVTDGVELMVFTNSNKEQDLAVHAMDQPATEWIRDLPHLPLGWLGRTHRWEKVPGRSMLARNLFDLPERVIPTVAHFLRERALGKDGICAQTPLLFATCSSYATKVLQVSSTDLDQINQLAARIAQVLNTEDDKELKKFLQARRKLVTLRAWLQRASVDRTLRTQEAEPFITERQWRLLFDAEDRVFLHRDLLFIGVLNHLHELKPAWRGRDHDDVSTDDLIPDADPDAENNR
ncbi:hypothetical protein MRI28_23460 [Nocardiopsis dassonvillei]|uniref:hypothetical protein n=1 Tax=Nocardiopsis dassonvillei TaxID=2014 RepID=UPI00201065AA|nr:hypothetical protein [Nocardiopsis dassonvillei]MCK9872560.1 hypothetical protein [Nocardiopsis dassonvillei]